MAAGQREPGQEPFGTHVGDGRCAHAQFRLRPAWINLTGQPMVQMEGDKKDPSGGQETVGVRGEHPLGLGQAVERPEAVVLHLPA